MQSTTISTISTDFLPQSGCIERRVTRVVEIATRSLVGKACAATQQRRGEADVMPLGQIGHPGRVVIQRAGIFCGGGSTGIGHTDP
ncbi:hypothetical protein SDC9_109145 [bioreactor metagenome]|uniref:Uncharacterized protein n=1 Tax=bioreactor metagenome TaxID=1076179 RepID=A0A645B9Y3_9ZZZZ